LLWAHFNITGANRLYYVAVRMINHSLRQAPLYSVAVRSLFNKYFINILGFAVYILNRMLNCLIGFAVSILIRMGIVNQHSLCILFTLNLLGKRPVNF
jgi:hypothetical protein